MDQAILRAIVAPTKLAWKSHLGKVLISTYGIDENNASSFPGAVTAVLSLSGDLEGRVLFILTEQTAKGVEAAFNSRWDDGINQRTLDSFSELLQPVVDNIPKLLETGGHKCTVELSGVMNTKGKGVAWGKVPPEVIMLASVPDFDNPSAKDEISVWVMVEAAGADHDSESPEHKGSEQEATNTGDEHEDDAEDAGALASPGTGISSEDRLTQDENAIMNELQTEFEHAPEPPLVSEQDVADMMAVEAAFAAEESDSNDERDSLSESEQSDGGSVEVYPAIRAGVVTTQKLEIVDADAMVRSVLATLRDGSPYLSIADATGRIRVTLRLDSKGDARLTFVDEMGAETWMAPRDEPPPAPEQDEPSPAREPEQAHKGAPPTKPDNRKSEPTGPGSNGSKSRPKAAASPSLRKPDEHKASSPPSKSKPPKKATASAAPPRKPAKTARKIVRRRRTVRSAGVR